VTYDSETEPVEFGSSGGGNYWAPKRGGGAIQLTVAGTLTVDGRVSANADAVTGSHDGGGAGGSVWLVASRLNGAGSITANGQVAGYLGSGSGGGGRIAIYTGVNGFTGTIAASGGEGGYRNGSYGSLHYGPNIPAGLISWWRGEGDASCWMTNSTWQQIVVTVSSNHVSHLYRNGQLLQMATGTGPIPYDGSQYFNLGKHQLLGRYFNGLADELMCFNRPLLPEEVATLYFNQGGPLQLNIQPTPGGVLLSWPASAASFGLVSRTNLTAGIWEFVTNAPSLNGDRKEVLLPANTPVQRFFRLAQ